MRVVEDREDLTALAVLDGTRYIMLGDADGNPTRDFVHASRHIEGRWRGYSLRLIRPGEAHSTILFWGPTGEFLAWYINLEDPNRRTPTGFESLDHTLDLLIAPDRQSWRWKDEDEFEHGIKHGWYTWEMFDELKAYGERVAEEARQGLPPFNEPWPEWRPDPTWEPAELPAGWDRV